ncbi:MAG: ribonuclease H-like domain-containing protein [Elusimicrobiota bacterium]
MYKKARCYFDIETFGGLEIGPSMVITVCGIYYESGDIVQLVGDEINAASLERCFEKSVVYTYNGSRFDIPVVKEKTGLDICKVAPCRDLMYDCWKKGLYGGLKKVEKKLGIYRETVGVDGMEAMALWKRYKEGSPEALRVLLKYNREDVVNLELLRKKLGVG